MRELSNHAKVAKLCKSYLKSLGIKGTCSSSRFSGGTSVSVRVEDVSPKMADELEKEFSKYEYGHFDGMTDYYECDNWDDSIPQVKYLLFNTDFSEGMFEKARKYLKDNHNVCDDESAQRCFGSWYDVVVRGVLNGRYDKQFFWGE
jgi:hypothetical protein